MLESTHLSVHEFMDRLIAIKQKEERCACYAPPPRITEKPSELVYKNKPQSDGNFQRRDNNNQYRNGDKWSRSGNSEANKSPNWRKDAKTDANKVTEKNQVTKQTEKSGKEDKSSEKNQNSSNGNRNCFRCGKPDHSFRKCTNPPLKEWETRKKHLVMMGAIDSEEDSDEDEARIPDNSGIDTAADYNRENDHGSVTGFEKIEGN